MQGKLNASKPLLYDEELPLNGKAKNKYFLPQESSPSEMYRLLFLHCKKREIG